jgi:hypothetical protein
MGRQHKKSPMKILTLFVSLLYASSVLSEDLQLINPRILKIQDNAERTILDYSVGDDFGMNQMLAPVGWTEPILALSYELRGIVIEGTLGLESQSGTAIFERNQGFFRTSGYKSTNTQCRNTPLRLVEVLRPSHKDSLVTVFEHVD